MLDYSMIKFDFPAVGQVPSLVLLPAYVRNCGNKHQCIFYIMFSKWLLYYCYYY